MECKDCRFWKRAEDEPTLGNCGQGSIASDGSIIVKRGVYCQKITYQHDTCPAFQFNLVEVK